MGSQAKERKAGGGRRSRNKGNNFERRLAADLREALDLGMSDVFRAPLSGGHPAMRAGDLMLSPQAQGLFPFSIEAKHVRKWSPDGLLEPRKAMELAWTKQCLEACGKLNPLLVLNGHGTGVYATGRRKELQTWSPGIQKNLPRLLWRNPADDDRVWLAIPWWALLAAIRNMK